MTITLEYKHENPTVRGWYVVLRRGVATPNVLWWSGNYQHWLEGARRVDVVAWEPIQMPKEEL